MKRMAFLVFAVLAACGPLAANNPTAGLARGIMNGTADDSPVAGPLDIVNRDFIDTQVNEIMLVSILSRDAVAIVVRAGNNGSKVTWLSPDGIGVTFDTGVLAATRGLGGDLMAAETSPVTAAFRTRGNYMKNMDYLTGLDQIERRQFTCSMGLDRREDITLYERVYQTDVYVESCEGGGESFQNYFWRGANGVIWQSRQWISAETGYLGYQRLN